MIKKFLGSMLVIFCSIGCGNVSYTDSSSTTGCDSTTAVILVWDGHFENLCGCEGTNQNGAVQTPGSALTCQVTSGDTVYFQFMGTATYHQIVSTDSPEKFGASFIQKSDPDERNWFFAVTLSESSVTYNYQDAFNAQMIGQIIVP